MFAVLCLLIIASVQAREADYLTSQLKANGNGIRQPSRTFHIRDGMCTRQLTREDVGCKYPDQVSLPVELEIQVADPSGFPVVDIEDDLSGARITRQGPSKCTGQAVISVVSYCLLYSPYQDY